GAVVPQADGLVVDLGGLGRVLGIVRPAAPVVAAGRRDEREREGRSDGTPRGPRHPTLPPPRCPGPTRCTRSVRPLDGKHVLTTGERHYHGAKAPCAGPPPR